VTRMRLIFGEHSRVRYLHSGVGVDVQCSYLIRVNGKLIHPGGQNGRMLAGDVPDVDVLIDVSLDHQLPRSPVDGPEITWLYGLGSTVNKHTLTNRELMAMLTRMFLGGSQFGHFAAASLIRSTYLRCAFSLVRKRNIVGCSVFASRCRSTGVCGLAVRLYMMASIFLTETWAI
jgi:hypothetical protein